MTKLVALLLLALFLCACSTTKPIIGALPKSNTDYMSSPTELRATYPDIDKHDGPFAHGILFQTIYDMPELREITSQLGEPDKKRLSWWNLYTPIVLTIVGFPPAWILGGSVLVASFHPTAVYRWEKPNYVIEAVVDHPIAFGYDPHLTYWRWYYDPEEKPGEPSRPILTTSNAHKSP